MAATSPRLWPRNLHWYEDLPPREAPVTGHAALYGDLNHIDECYLEISRASTRMRGGLVLIGFVVVFSFIGILPLFWPPDFTASNGNFEPSALLLWLVWAPMPLMILLSFRLDLTTPRDEPVRFNRRHGKVYTYEFKWSYNPFGRWRPVTRVFDWHNIQAEITRQVGFNGRVVVTRYALVLACCRPGTDRVVERFTLKGNMMTILELRQTWAYVCQYMAAGQEAVPACPLRPQAVSLRRSLFTFLPLLDPTREGSAHRRKLNPIEWFLEIVLVFFVWMLLPLGLCHYIAMRFSPPPRWPPELDAEFTRG